MPWQLAITAPARKELRRLARADRRAIGQTLDRMIVDPGSVDLAKLSGHEGEWRLRVGHWRVRLVFDNDSGTMYVVGVAPRREAYRD